MTYIPEDRRAALAANRELPHTADGAVLFADISGFTALTEALATARGARSGADEATRRLNQVYNALIETLHAYGGAVISFSGDGMLCWFADESDSEWTALRRALGAAFAVQQRMRPFATIPIDDSMAVHLGIKTTVAGGPARRFVVGDPAIQRIDVLVGKVVDRTSTAEQLANQGETLVDEETLLAVRQAVEIDGWRLNKDGQRFAVVRPIASNEVKNIPQPCSVADVEVELPSEQAEQWLLPAVSNWLAGGHIGYLGELRPAVALFVRINGLDTEHDPDAPAKLDAYVRWVQQILAQVEGSLIQVTTGDKGGYLYAAFGAPVAHDDDPRRAATVARLLLQPPTDLAFRPDVQTGIARGRMRVGPYGSDSRRTFGVQGPAVNLAAGLMMAAEPGQILLDQQMAATLAPHYRLTPVANRRVKGRKEPMSLHALGTARKNTPIAFGETDNLTIYGRSEPLRHLHDLAERLRDDRQGSVVRIEGEAGIGKSRLVAAFADQLKASGFTIAAGAGRNVERNTAYLAARQMARWLLGLGPKEQAPPAAQVAHVQTMLESLNPEWLLRLPLLGDLLDLPIPDNQTTAAFEPQLRRAALITLTTEIIQAAAQATPLVLLVEDAQWLDEASLDLLTALARVVDRTPVLLLIVHRPAQRETASTVEALTALPNRAELLLAGLDRSNINALIESRLQRAISPLALDLIERQVQGNPFYCEELIGALCASGDLRETRGRDGQRWELSAAVIESLKQARCLVQREGEWRLSDEATLAGVAPGLPDSIHGAVLARFDRLDEADKLTLKVISVIGRTAPTPLIEAAYPSEIARTDLADRLDRLTRQNFLRRVPSRAANGFEFIHNITQEVIYRLLLEEQRQDLHLSVGRVLERTAPMASDLLAHHFYHAPLDDPAVRARAIEHLDRAAQRARSDYANEAAIFHLQRMLELQTHWQWLADQVALYHLLGRRDDELAALTRLTDCAETPPFQLAFAWAEYFETASEYDQAIEQVQKALEFATHQNDRAGQARCLTRLGLIAWRQGKSEAAAAQYRGALELLAEEPIFQDESADVHYGLGLVHRQQGAYDAALAQFNIALEMVQAQNNRQAEAKLRIAIGHVENNQHNLDAALAAYRAGLDLYRMTGDRAGLGAGLVSLAQGVSAAGDFEDANRLLAEALEIHQALGDLWWQTIVWNELAINAGLVGQLDQAAQSLQVGLSLSTEIGDESGVAYALCNLGQIRRYQVRLDEAETLMNQGIDLARKQADTGLEANYLMEMALISQEQQRDEEAIAQAQSSLRIYAALDLDESNLTNLTTLALSSLRIGNQKDARQFADDALVGLEQSDLDASSFPQRAYWVCANVYRALDESSLADKCLSVAHRLVQTQAGRLQSETLKRSFLENLPFNRQIIAQTSRLGDESAS